MANPGRSAVAGGLRETGSHRCQRRLPGTHLFSLTRANWHCVSKPNHIGAPLTHDEPDRQSDSQTDAVGATDGVDASPGSAAWRQHLELRNRRGPGPAAASTREGHQHLVGVGASQA